jgi:hypothetical protein
VTEIRPCSMCEKWCLCQYSRNQVSNVLERVERLSSVSRGKGGNRGLNPVANWRSENAGLDLQDVMADQFVR